VHGKKVSVKLAEILYLGYLGHPDQKSLRAQENRMFRFRDIAR